MQIKKHSNKRIVWSRQGEKLLIQIWANRLFHLRDTKQRRYVLMDMASEMQSNGLEYSAQEIKFKMKSLSSKYKEELAMMQEAGISTSTWPLFDDIHGILGKEYITRTQIENEDNTIIKCGEVQLIKNNWNLQFSCAECGKEMTHMQDFLLHSIQHHFAVTEDEMNLLISQIGKNDAKERVTSTSKILEDESDNQHCLVIDLDSNIIEEKNYADEDEVRISSEDVSESTPIADTSSSSMNDLPELQQVEVPTLNKHKSSNHINFEFLDTGTEENNEMKEDAVKMYNSMESQQQSVLPESEIKFVENDFENFICKQCLKAFENVAEYAEHLKFHKGFNLYECPKCERSYVLITQLKRHLEKHLNSLKKMRHSKTNNNDSDNANQSGQVHNKEVSEITSTISIELVTKNIENVEENDIYPEEIYIESSFNAFDPIVENEDTVDQRVNDYQQSESEEMDEVKESTEGVNAVELIEENLTNIENEETIDQQENSKTDEIKEVSKCKICNKITKDRRTQAIHRQKHALELLHGPKPKKKREHKCDICPKIFSKRSILLEHQRRHEKAAFVTCEICGATFPDSSNLNSHIKRHLGIKKHKCDLCEKSFVAANELKNHMRSHTGERPYVCQECGCSFKTSSSYSSHRRRHANDRQHSCETCGKSFFNKVALRNHQKTHTGEKPYSCTKCNISFGLMGSLTQHMKLHSDIKGYTCKICGEAFSQNAGLYSHMKKHKKQTKS